ncbi:MULTISPECIES: hypothetical protein [Bradyrhizobium]|nr:MULTISPECIES: hypothetical protein [Bradyrhizobium]NPU10305.1 hypothetical protein [Bradyrhizobium aeschynomenes]NPV19619.1 hypothetical protein [Bradyrhizobium aeschynomenes]
MPIETTEPQGNRRPAAPIPTSNKPSRDQLTPPLMVDGLEAVRDTHC